MQLGKWKSSQPVQRSRLCERMKQGSVTITSCRVLNKIKLPRSARCHRSVRTLRLAFALDGIGIFKRFLLLLSKEGAIGSWDPYTLLSLVSQRQQALEKWGMALKRLYGGWLSARLMQNRSRHQSHSSLTSFADPTNVAGSSFRVIRLEEAVPSRRAAGLQ